MHSMFNPPNIFLHTPGKPALQWKKWLRSFDNYIVAIDGQEFKPEKKKALMFTFLGNAAIDVFDNLKPITAPTEEGAVWNVYLEAIARLQKQFDEEPNVMIERHKFYKRKQFTDENIEEYVAALRVLAANCDFGENIDVYIRDQFVFNCESKKIQERILACRNPKLAEVLELAKSIERSTISTKVINTEISESVNAIHIQNRFANRTGRGAIGRVSVCYRCGSKTHIGNNPICPASGRKCNKCNKLGHFQSVCRNNKTPILAINMDTENTEDRFVKEVLTIDGLSEYMAVNAILTGFKAPLGEVSIGGVRVEVMADSGSPITILSEDTFKDRWSRHTLIKPDINPRAFGNFEIKMLGYFVDTLTYKDRTIETKIYVAVNGRDIVGWFDLGKLRIELRPGTAQPISLGAWEYHGKNEQVNCIAECDDGLRRILDSHKPVFEDKVGRVRGFEHHIRLIDGAQPIQHKVRIVPLAIRAKLKEHLALLEQEGIIEPVNGSQWISAIVIALKKNGQIRLCADLRTVNKNIVVECHPLPRIQEMLSAVNGAKYFSIIDLKSAYHQVELTEDSRDLTAFVTPFGVYRYIRLPFGLASAASVFQRLMDKLFGDIAGVQAFQDDVLVFARTVKEHNLILDKVLQILQERGMTVSAEKCKFMLSELDYLGHKITQEGIKPKDDLVSAINKAAAPTDKDTLRSFLGLGEYYARFVEGFAVFVEPMRKLLRKGVRFEWGVEQNLAFEKVKQLIVHAKALKPFDPEGKNVIKVDASTKGLGAVFTQLINGKENTVSFISRALRGAEEYYSTIEKEALACVWAVERLKTYLWGKKFILYTDHKPLIYLFEGKGSGNASSRLIRLVARLQEFNFEVRHISGGNNSIADTLSRMPEPENGNKQMDNTDECVVSAIDAVEFCEGITNESSWVAETKKDQTFNKIRQYQTSGWPNSRNIERHIQPYEQVSHELTWHGDVLCRNDLFVPPSALRLSLIQSAHKGHTGITGTTALLKEHYWWPEMNGMIREFVDNCPVCLNSDKKWKVSVQPLSIKDCPQEVWEKVSIDLAGPYNILGQQNRFLLVVIDNFTKWIYHKFLANTEVEQVISFLDEIFKLEGVPKILCSDNGTQFTSRKMKEYLENKDVKTEYSPLYFPTANGQVERANRFLKDGIQLPIAIGLN